MFTEGERILVGSAITYAEGLYIGKSVFMTVLMRKMAVDDVNVSEEIIKQKVARLTKFAYDCQHLRGALANRKPRNNYDSNQGILLYTLDDQDPDESAYEGETALGPIELLIYLLRQKYEPHALITKWKVKDEWIHITKNSIETYGGFFIR